MKILKKGILLLYLLSIASGIYFSFKFFLCSPNDEVYRGLKEISSDEKWFLEYSCFVREEFMC